jgi:uncharacterized protein YneR
MRAMKPFFAAILFLALAVVSCRPVVIVAEGPPGKEEDGRQAEVAGISTSPDLILGEDGYWYINGENTGIKAKSEITVGEDGCWHVDGESTGIKAKPDDNYGPPEIYIGEDGYWYINGKRTIIKASPEDENMPPEIHIGEDGYWYINGENSGIKAGFEIYVGEDGYWHINGAKTKIKASADVVVGEGGYLYIDGENTGFQKASFVEFFDDGVFDFPDGVTKIYVTACGAGGRGGGGNGPDGWGGGGGGGGAFVVEKEIDSAFGSQIIISVGKCNESYQPGGSTIFSYPTVNPLGVEVLFPFLTLPGGRIGSNYNYGAGGAGDVDNGIYPGARGGDGFMGGSHNISFGGNTAKDTITATGGMHSARSGGGGASLGPGGGGGGENGTNGAPGGLSNYARGGAGGPYGRAGQPGQGITGGQGGVANGNYSGGGGGAFGGGGGGGGYYNPGWGGHGYVLITWDTPQVSP